MKKLLPIIVLAIIATAAFGQAGRHDNQIGGDDNGKPPVKTYRIGEGNQSQKPKENVTPASTTTLKGDPGEKGDAGETGAPGHPGHNGRRGPRGATGQSANSTRMYHVMFGRDKTQKSWGIASEGFVDDRIAKQHKSDEREFALVAPKPRPAAGPPAKTPPNEGTQPAAASEGIPMNNNTLLWIVFVIALIVIAALAYLLRRGTARTTTTVTTAVAPASYPEQDIAAIRTAMHFPAPKSERGSSRMFQRTPGGFVAEEHAWGDQVVTGGRTIVVPGDVVQVLPPTPAVTPPRVAVAQPTEPPAQPQPPRPKRNRDQEGGAPRTDKPGGEKGGQNRRDLQQIGFRQPTMARRTPLIS